MNADKMYRDICRTAMEINGGDYLQAREQLKKMYLMPSAYGVTWYTALQCIIYLDKHHAEF